MATDIKEILSGYNLTENEVDQIVKAVYGNYRSIKELEKKDQRIQELTDQVGDLSAKVDEAAEAGAKVDELQEVVKQFEEKEQQRRAAAEEQARRDSFAVTFNAEVGERKFANDLIRDTVFEKVYTLCQNETGTGVKDALNSVTENVVGVWISPQTDPSKMPGADFGNNNKNDNAARTKRDFARKLFGSGGKE